jgi:hypothetical protein
MVTECNKIKKDCKTKEMSELKEEKPTSGGFKELLGSMMKRRWFITAIVLGGFMVIIMGIFGSIVSQTEISGEWKELLLLLLGAFIGSYGKIIDYWFSDTDKDKMLVQKMDEEDGTSLSNTADMPVTPPNNTPLIPEAFTTAISNVQSQPQVVSVVSEPNNPQKVDSPFKSETKVGVEIDEDGDGVMDGLDFDGDGKIDEYFAHRQCEHVWGDLDGDGVLECLKCGKIQDSDPDDHMEG